MSTERMTADDIEVVRIQDLGGLHELSHGLGIFINCGNDSVQVGAILPYPDGRYQLNVMIIADTVPTHHCCDFTESHDSIEDAIVAARAFLASQRK